MSGKTGRLQQRAVENASSHRADPRDSPRSRETYGYPRVHAELQSPGSALFPEACSAAYAKGWA